MSSSVPRACAAVPRRITASVSPTDCCCPGWTPERVSGSLILVLKTPSRREEGTRGVERAPSWRSPRRRAGVASGLRRGRHVGVTSAPDICPPHPCAFEAGVASGVLEMLGPSLCRRCGVFHSSPPSQGGEDHASGRVGRKTNLRGSGSGDTCLGRRTSHQVFLGLGLQSRRVGTVHPCESGALGDPFSLSR